MSDLDRSRSSATTFRVSADAAQADRELQKFQERLDQLNNQVNRLSRNVDRSSNSSIKFTRSMRGTTAGSTRLGNATNKAGAAMAAFNGNIATAGGLVGGVLGFAISQTVERLVTLGAQAESTRKRFLALSETIADGRRRYQEFADFADDRGLRFQGLVEAANQLRVVGFAGDDLDELITQIGITAGNSVERVERITRALGQMRAFGRVALEELNQLTEAGIPIITAIANELDIPEGKVRGLIELGKIDFETVRNAFADLASESSVFFAASEAQSETLQASFNRLGNAMFMFADELNERTSPALKFFVEGAADVTGFFSTFEGQIIGLTTLVFPIFLTALGGLLLVIIGHIRSTDPLILAYRKINVQLAVAQVNAGRLRRHFYYYVLLCEHLYLLVLVLLLLLLLLLLYRLLFMVWKEQEKRQES